MDRVTENDLIVLIPYVLALTLVGVAIIKPPRWFRRIVDRVNRAGIRYAWPLVPLACAFFVVLAALSIFDGHWSNAMFEVGIALLFGRRAPKVWRDRVAIRSS